MKKKILSGLIAVAVSQPLWAENLMQVYQKALSYDSGLAASRYAYRASQAAIDQSRATLLPNFSAFGNATHNFYDPGNGSDTYNTANYGLKLSQPLFQADAYYNYQGSKFQSDTAKAQFNVAQQKLMLDVATAYFNVLRAQDTLTTAKATEAALKRQWEQAKEQYDVGLIAITGVHEARASYDASISQRITAESQVDIAKEKLARLTGGSIAQLDNLEQHFPISAPQPMNPGAWEQTALKQNWSIKAAEYQVKASNESLKSRKAGHYPSLDLTASLQRVGTFGRGNAAALAAGGGINGWANDATVGLQLNVPLYAGGGINAGIRNARATYNQTEEQLKTQQRNVKLDTRTFFRSVNSDIQTVSAQRQSIISSRSALEATRAGYAVGTRNIVEVLNAEKNYYVALQGYANARYDYVIDSLSLKNAAGTLSPQDLADLNKWLSASAPGIGALAKEPSDNLPTPKKGAQ